MDEREQMAWDIYYASVASIRFHPKNDENVNDEVEIKRAADRADKMIEERRKRFDMNKVGG